MRSFIAVAAVSLATSSAAFAGHYLGPLIVKESGTGFVMVESTRREKCEIFVDKVVVTKSYGGGEAPSIALREERAIRLTGPIAATIELAARESLAAGEVAICDAPSTRIVAYKGLNSGEAEEVLLLQSPNCSVRQLRQGPAAEMLRDLAAEYCPKTNDIGNPSRR